MLKRLFKQTMVVFVLVVLASGVFLLTRYFTKTEPTCSDGIQNQGEEGIDCGGPCVECGLVYPDSIEVLWAKAVPNQEGYYDLVAEIHNPNQNYGSGSMPYQFLISYSEKISTKKEFSGTTFILPKQKKYLVKTKAPFSRELASSETALSEIEVELEIGKTEWQRIENYQVPRLAVYEKEYRLLDEASLGQSRAKGILANKSSFDFDRVIVDVLLLNEEREIVGVNSVEIRTLLSGQERDLTSTWFNKIKETVSFIEMEAETNIFDPDNLLSLPEGERERFQEY